jgi:MFS family permease
LGGTEVRRLVLVVAMLAGLFVFDEYFPFVARENGATTAMVPVLIGLTVAGQALGTILAGRTARLRARPLAWATGAAAVLIALGAVDGRWIGFVAIAVGYGLLSNVYIVSGARLQESISGPARATVTSMSGLLEEVFSVTVFVGFALGSQWLSVSVLVIVLTIPMVVIAILVSRWLPAAAGDHRDAPTVSRRP